MGNMTQFNAPAFSIERPTGQCAVTGRQLQPDETYVATLVEVDPQTTAGSEGKSQAAGVDLKRIDVSMEAWDQGNRPDRLYCFWRATIPQPNQRRKMFVDDTVLYNLFLRLEDAQQPQRQGFRFVLALILMRKRLLRYDGAEREETGADQSRQWWKVAAKVDITKGPLGKWDDKNPLRVLNPQLDDQQIQQVTEQLGEILEAEL
jgi:hypothetical protein